MAVDVFDRRLILVVGKGGVGRSTVAAAIAGQCAARGRKTLLFETNANDRFGAYYDRPAVGPKVTELAPNLSAVNTNPATALEEYGLMILRWKSVYEMVFENRVTKAFLRAIPGLDDYALLGKAWYHTTEEKRGKPVWDTVIFDLPASGHSVSMLKIPWVIIDTVPEGPLTRDARTIKDLLCDPARTAAVLVTLAEEMPVNEAVELEGKLSGLGIVPQQIVCNQIYPDHFPEGMPVARVLDTLSGDPRLPTPLGEVTTHAVLSRDRRALNMRYLGELRRRAKTTVKELPMLFTPQLTPAHVRALGERLTRASE
ncbi:MAG: Anion-transporting ATPase [Myxococcales bacterium]|nr:Anion-transporting ATPase [Myxococcales bacterium]